jgi:hypothetical protein
LAPPVLDPALRRLHSSGAGEGGDDPLFELNAEVARQRAAGEDVVDSTAGTFLVEDGRLATSPAVGEVLAGASRQDADGSALIGTRTLALAAAPFLAAGVAGG